MARKLPKPQAPAAEALPDNVIPVNYETQLAATPAGYDDLPVAIKAMYTPLEYRWMSDDQRNNITSSATEPEFD